MDATRVRGDGETRGRGDGEKGRRGEELRPRTVIYILSVVTLALAVGGSFLAFKNESARNRALKFEAAATIDNVDVRRATDPVFGDEDTVDMSVRYSYEVNGNKYQRTTRLSKAQARAFVPWGRAKVCYAEGDKPSIEEGKLFPLDHQCGSD